MDNTSTHSDSSASTTLSQIDRDKIYHNAEKFLHNSIKKSSQESDTRKLDLQAQLAEKYLQNLQSIPMNKRTKSHKNIIPFFESFIKYTKAKEQTKLLQLHVDFKEFYQKGTQKNYRNQRNKDILNSKTASSNSNNESSDSSISSNSSTSHSAQAAEILEPSTLLISDHSAEEPAPIWKTFPSRPSVFFSTKDASYKRDHGFCKNTFSFLPWSRVKNDESIPDSFDKEMEYRVKALKRINPVDLSEEEKKAISLEIEQCQSLHIAPYLHAVRQALGQLKTWKAMQRMNCLESHSNDYGDIEKMLFDLEKDLKANNMDALEKYEEFACIASGDFILNKMQVLLDQHSAKLNADLEAIQATLEKEYIDFEKKYQTTSEKTPAQNLLACDQDIQAFLKNATEMSWAYHSDRPSAEKYDRMIQDSLDKRLQVRGRLVNSCEDLKNSRPFRAKYGYLYTVNLRLKCNSLKKTDDFSQKGVWYAIQRLLYRLSELLRLSNQANREASFLLFSKPKIDKVKQQKNNLYKGPIKH
jgi:hypothetical protein